MSRTLTRKPVKPTKIGGAVDATLCHVKPFEL